MATKAPPSPKPTTVVHTPTGALRISSQTTPDVLIALQADNAVTTEDKPLPADLTTRDIYVQVVVSLEGGGHKGVPTTATTSTTSVDDKGKTTTLTTTTTKEKLDVLAILVELELRTKLQEMYTATSEDTAKFILQVYVTMVSTTNRNKLIGRGGGNCKACLEWFLASRATSTSTGTSTGTNTTEDPHPHPAEIFKAGRLSKQAFAVFERNKCLTDKVVPDMVQELVRTIGIAGASLPDTDTVHMAGPPPPLETTKSE
jgi:hypothetical protein